MEFNFKIPKIKFGKIKMDSVENLEELKLDTENLKPEPIKKRNEPYQHTNYKTVKEFFYRSAKLYADEDCILEKPDKKVPFKTITYKQFSSSKR